VLNSFRGWKLFLSTLQFMGGLMKKFIMANSCIGLKKFYNQLFFLPSPERNIVFLGFTLNGQLYLKFLVDSFSMTNKEIWTFQLFLGNSKGGFFSYLVFCC
jgi:hypothetical protein